MIKAVLWTLIFSQLFSCASKKTGAPYNLDSGIDQIQNKDFEAVQEVKYQSHADSFEASIGTIDALSKESIARLPKAKLEEISEGQNPISKVASLCYQRKFEQAFEILDGIYRQYKSHPSYWNQVGTCYYLQGNNRKALLYYNKSRDLDKKYVPAINNLGVIYQQEGEDQKAIVAYQQACDLNHFALTAPFNLVNLYLKYGLSDKAIGLLQGISRNNSKDVDVNNALAVAHLLKNEIDKALTYYRAIDSDYLERADISLNYAVALKLANKRDDAQDIFSEIEKDKIGNLKDYYNRVASFIGAK